VIVPAMLTTQLRMIASALRPTAPLDPNNFTASRRRASRHTAIGGDSVAPDHRGDRLPASGDQIVEQARKLERTSDLVADDLCPHAASAHEHAGVDEILDRPPHRRARHLPATRQLEFVAEEFALPQLPALDRLDMPSWYGRG
jgi:hypothetical protein